MKRPGDQFRSKTKAAQTPPKKRPNWLENMHNREVSDLGEDLDSWELEEAAKRGNAAMIQLVVRRAESWAWVLRFVEQQEAAKPILERLAEERTSWPVLAEFPASEKWAAQVRSRMISLRLGARRADASKRPRDQPKWIETHEVVIMALILDAAKRLDCRPNDKRALEAGWFSWLEWLGGDVFNVPGILENLRKSPGFPEKNSLETWEKTHPRPSKPAPVSREDINQFGRENAETIALMKPQLKWRKDRAAKADEIQKAQRAWMGKQRAEVKRQLLAAAMARLGQVTSAKITPDESPG